MRLSLTRSASWLTSFNSRTPGGVRLLSDEIPAYEKEFQFTHPGRGATYGVDVPQGRGDVSIHAPREGCDSKVVKKFATDIDVSIHAPREGCDFRANLRVSIYDIVSIHAPREGCDRERGVCETRYICFNSRTPGGVRRMGFRDSLDDSLCFNSRTPGGVRLICLSVLVRRKIVSIHAPREGCDFMISNPRVSSSVSIHAPREGCDVSRCSCLSFG